MPVGARVTYTAGFRDDRDIDPAHPTWTFPRFPGSLPFVASTAELSDEERRRLGRAVKEARIGAGFRTLPEFHKETGVSAKTLGKLEAGVAVDETTVITVARHLPGWETVGWQERARGAGNVGGRGDRDYVRRDDVSLPEALRLLRRAAEDNARVAVSLTEAVNYVAGALDQDDE